MKTLTFTYILLISALNLNAQKLISKTGHISFFSKTPVENIEAHNHQVASILDPQTGDLQVSLLVRSFEFKKELMQEHFNENYMESDLYPKSSLKGKIANISEINFSKEGDYQVSVKGELTIHGVTKPITVIGTIKVSKSTITSTATFKVLTADFNIQIPDLVKDNIAKEIEIFVKIPYEK